MLKRTFKYRIYPTNKQRKALQASLDACRLVYNKTLETRKTAWETEQKTLSYYGTLKFLPAWKEEKPELINAYSQSLQNTQLRIDLAYKAFFRRVKKGEEKPGHPRFKGYYRYDSFTFPQNNGGFKLYPEAKKLRIYKAGHIKIKLHRDIQGKIKTLTLRRSSTGKWYACFSCEIESKKPLRKTKSVVGIDVGLETFATLSTGKKIKNPRFFKHSAEKIAKKQRRLSAAKKGTPRRKKLKQAVSRAHEKVKNQRTDFAHKQSLKLIKKHQVIAFEKLNIQQMKSKDPKKKYNFKSIRKSIQDVAWRQFTSYTAYKAEEAGRQVVFVNPRNTSKMCSRCGQIVEKKLSDRIHKCTCGLRMDRDLNASINILGLGLQSLQSKG